MDLPPLDCHAHVSPDVSSRQLAQLGSAVVFAMTREPIEAAEAAKRYDDNLLWCCGAHPAFVAGGGEVDLDQFTRRSKRFAVVGEIGLDRRSGNLERQKQVLAGILDRIQNEPVLVSIHSSGSSSEIVELLRRRPRQGLILHWFSGRPAEVDQLLSIGCYFSVNTAMRRELLKAVPLDRLLPETDFPVARKRTGARPGDTAQLEILLGEIHQAQPLELRRQFYRNLRRISIETGAIDRMPAHLSDKLLAA